MKDAHRRLRAATAHAHEAVDAAFGGYDLSDRDGYTRFLSAHAEVMVPLEAALDAAGAERVTADWGTRKRGALILADLAALHSHGVRGEPVDAGLVPTPFDKLRVSAGVGVAAGSGVSAGRDAAAPHSSRAQAEPVEAGWRSPPFDELRVSAGEDRLPTLAGILYVVEGSRLGGRFLARRVPAAFPKSYLDAHQPSGNWAKLLASIDQILYDEGRTATAIDAALETFVLFERAGRNWLVKE